MSILDQLQDIINDANARSTEKNNTAFFALASHIMMEKPSESSGQPINFKFPRVLNNGAISAVSIVDTLVGIQANYQRLVLAEQFKDIGEIPNVDYVIDSGIKRGSKVIIEVVGGATTPDLSKSQFDKAMTVLGAINGRVRGDISVDSLYFDKFSVVSITEPDEERYMIHETFGGDILDAFGHRPRLLTLSGNVINGRADISYGGQTVSMDWKNALQRFFNKSAALRKTSILGKKLRIRAQDTIYDCHGLNLVVNTSSESQNLSQVTMTFLIADRNYVIENDSLIPGTPTETGFRLAGSVVPRELFPQSRLEEYLQEDFIDELGEEWNNANSDYLHLRSKFVSEAKTTTENVVEQLENSDLETYYPAKGWALSKLLKGSEIEKQVIELDKEERNTDNNIDDIADNALIYARKYGTRNTVRNLNIKAQQLLQKYKQQKELGRFLEYE